MTRGQGISRQRAVGAATAAERARSVAEGARPRGRNPTGTPWGRGSPTRKEPLGDAVACCACVCLRVCLCARVREGKFVELPVWVHVSKVLVLKSDGATTVAPFFRFEPIPRKVHFQPATWLRWSLCRRIADCHGSSSVLPSEDGLQLLLWRSTAKLSRLCVA